MKNDKNRPQLTKFYKQFYGISADDKDLELLKNIYNLEKVNNYFFPYGNPTINDDHQGIDNNVEKENLIILGNSGDKSNCHLEIIDSIIQKPDYRSFNYIVPYSYNGSKDMQDEIESNLKNEHMDYEILDKFIDPSEYNTLIKKSLGLITAHHRQQSVGTIRTVLKEKGTVFLRKKINVCGEEIENPGWHIFENDGLAVKDYNQFHHYESITSAMHLDDETLTNNSKIIAQNYSVNEQVDSLIKILNKIKDECPHATT